MRNLLFDSGLGDIWYNHDVVNVDVVFFAEELTLSLHDMYCKQGWSFRLELSPSADFYRKYKNGLGISH